MRIQVTNLREQVELTISSSGAVEVGVDGKQVAKHYIMRHGVTISPGNAQRHNGTVIAWRELAETG